MKKRITEIINELREVIKEECLSISHDTLFSESILIYRGEKAGEQKRGGYNQSGPATEKQIAYAQQLADKKGITINVSEKSTMGEVSKLIEDLKK